MPARATTAPPADPPPRGALARRVLLVALLAVLPYVLLAPKPMLLDAKQAIRGNETLEAASPIPVLTSDFWGRPMDVRYATRSYRPLVSLSWWIQQRTTGLSPVALHVVDIGLHATTAVLVLLLLGALVPDRTWTTAAAALWGVHPVLSEAVCSFVGRADILASGLLLCALLAQVRAARGGRPVALGALAALCVTAALFCKEYAVAFPFLILAVDLLLWRAGRRAAPLSLAALAWAGSFAGLAVYLSIRYALAGEIGGVPMIGEMDQPLVGASLSARWGTAAWLTLLGMRLLVLPTGLSYFYYGHGTLTLADGLFDPRSLAGIAVLALLAGAAIWLLERRRDPLPALAYVLFLFPLGPSLNTVSLAGVLFAERYLYVPAAGLALLAASIAAKRAAGPGPRRAALVIFVLLIGGGAVMTAKRVEDWSSLESLARSSLDAYPDSAILWQELAFAKGLEGDHEEAARLFETSIEKYDKSPKVWRNYGVSLLHLGRFGEAADAFRSALQLTPPDLGVLWRSLGRAEVAAGRFEEAAAALRRAAELMPEDAPTRDFLAQALLRRAQEHLQAGEEAPAGALAREVLELDGLPPEATSATGG